VKTLRNYFSNFISLFFPQLCHACGENLVSGEMLICTKCIYNLPYTNFHQQKDNVVAQQFWGRLKIENAHALCYFTKGGSVQELMHRFKYDDVPGIGNKFGQLTGAQIRDSWPNVDVIIPVPLHKSKLRKRGYNQSATFAVGLANKLEAVVDEKSLQRIKKTESQTKKSRAERASNMAGVFTVANASNLAGKHVLLVDDIMTTGATLEACGRELLKVEGLRLSIATIAYTA
jgi:ComF family protein